MTSTKHTRNMTKVFLAMLTILAALSWACVDDAGSTTCHPNAQLVNGRCDAITNATNNIADDIDNAANSLGLPEMLSSDIAEKVIK